MAPPSTALFPVKFDILTDRLDPFSRNIAPPVGAELFLNIVSSILAKPLDNRNAPPKLSTSLSLNLQRSVVNELSSFMVTRP